MKNVLIAIILFGVVIGVGFFGIPVLIEKKTEDLKSDVQDLKQRIQKIEEESKVVPLPLDAGAKKIIKTVNAISIHVNSLENSFKKETAATNELIKKQMTVNEDAFKKQAEVIEKINKEIQERMQKIMFDATIEGIKGHILKTRVDLVAKNIGTAKTELDFINGSFEKAKTSASDEHKKVIDELQTTLKRAMAEIDTDLPAALNRIDLLWHEMGKLLRKT